MGHLKSHCSWEPAVNEVPSYSLRSNYGEPHVLSSGPRFINKNIGNELRSIQMEVWSLGIISSSHLLEKILAFSQGIFTSEKWPTFLVMSSSIRQCGQCYKIHTMASIQMDSCEHVKLQSTESGLEVQYYLLRWTASLQGLRGRSLPSPAAKAFSNGSAWDWTRDFLHAQQGSPEPQLLP